MTRKIHTDSALARALRKVALRYPEAEEGIACQGTALECSAFKARSKTFLFAGTAELKLKLRTSLSQAAKLAAKEPNHYAVGATGWITVKFSPGESPPFDLLENWIDESYRLLVPRQLVARLPQRGLPTAGPTQKAKRKVKKKKR